MLGINQLHKKGPLDLDEYKFGLVVWPHWWTALAIVYLVVDLLSVRHKQWKHQQPPPFLTMLGRQLGHLYYYEWMFSGIPLYSHIDSDAGRLCLCLECIGNWASWSAMKKCLLIFIPSRVQQIHCIKKENRVGMACFTRQHFS